MLIIESVNLRTAFILSLMWLQLETWLASELDNIELLLSQYILIQVLGLLSKKNIIVT